jgi:hypothetical protein
MRALTTCLAALLLSGLLAALPCSADGPLDDLPIIGGQSKKITDLCVQPLDDGGPPPATPADWYATYNDPPKYQGWKVWVADPGQWWFVGLCDAGGRLRFVDLCVIPDFTHDPAPDDPSDSIRAYKQPPYNGRLVWFGLGGPTGGGSWWFFGTCLVNPV